MSEILRIVTIPFQGGQMIMPENAVVEVLPYAKPLRIENAPLWVVGSILWMSIPIPIISLERLAFQVQPEPGGHARIVVMHLPVGDHGLRDVGVLSVEPPQSAEIQREEIRPSGIEGESIAKGIAGWVWLFGREAIIPDLDVIEEALRHIGHN